MKNGIDVENVLNLIDGAAKSYPLKKITSIIGKPYSTLANELSNQPGYKLGLITALQIVQTSGDYRAIDEIEKGFGRVAINLPDPEYSNHGIHQLVMMEIEAFGNLISETEKSLMDGILTKREKKDLGEKGYRLMQTIGAFLSAVERAKNGQK